MMPMRASNLPVDGSAGTDQGSRAKSISSINITIDAGFDLSSTGSKRRLFRIHETSISPLQTSVRSR
jgi:hypothetical protein